MKPSSMTEIIGRKRYSTDNATLIAGDDYWDGHNYERRGTNTFLYKTAKGNYFTLHLTQWQGQENHIEAVTLDEAVSLWEGMRERRLEFHEAFPGIVVEEA